MCMFEILPIIAMVVAILVGIVSIVLGGQKILDLYRQKRRARLLNHLRSQDDDKSPEDVLRDIGLF